MRTATPNRHGVRWRRLSAASRRAGRGGRAPHSGAGARGKVIPVVESLLTEYKLDRDQALLVGEGGGAAALIPFVAERMQLAFRFRRMPKSSPPSASRLALVRETVERVIPNPTPEDLQRHQARSIRRGGEARRRAGERGGDDRSRCADATGARDGDGRFRDARAGSAQGCERRGSAHDRRKLDGSARRHVQLVAATDQMRVFQGQVEERKWRFFKTPALAGARGGSRRRDPRSAQRWCGRRCTRAATGLDQLRQVWEQVTIYNGDSVITPDVFVIAGRRVVDLSGVTALDQALAIGRSELEGLAPETPVALISVQGARGI